MKKYSITLVGLEDYSEVTKSYLIANECCCLGICNQMPEVTFTFKSKCDLNCFKSMAGNLLIKTVVEKQ
jgi:hypothetical protein